MSIVAVTEGEVDDGAFAGFLASNPWVEHRGAAAREARVLVGRRFGASCLERVKAAPWCGAVEIGDGSAAMGEAFRRHLAAGGVGLALRTDTAYATRPADLLLQVLAARFGVAGTRLDAATLAVHEAVANALVHGNLEIASFAEGDTGSFLAYCADLDARLADERFAGRMLWLSAAPVGGGIEIVVEDQGQGYDGRGGHHADDVRRHGLGLIQELSGTRIENDGRRIVMTFER
jgi:sigma-B regulation protein RsbU (phosphoserine phosphatase)